MAVMPGMINAHTHLFQTFIRGLADDKPLLDWLKAAIWPVAQALTGEDAYLAAMLGLVENIRGGATSVIDHQYIHTEPDNDDGVFRAAEEIGVRFLNARGWADIGYHPRLHGDPRADHRGDGASARPVAGPGQRPDPGGVRPADPLGMHRCDDGPHAGIGCSVGRRHAHPRGRDPGRDGYGPGLAGQCATSSGWTRSARSVQTCSSSIACG